MPREVVVGTYSIANGLKLEWVPDFKIAVTVLGNEVTIHANTAGLQSLAQHFLTLAQEVVPDGAHIHLEPGLELEDDSVPLVIDRASLYMEPLVQPSGDSSVTGLGIVRGFRVENWSETGPSNSQGGVRWNWKN